MEASKVIQKTLRLIGVLDSNETPEAEDAESALDELNALFAEWRGSDLMVPDYYVGSITEQLTIDLADRDAVAYQLALRMSPEYGASLTAEARDAMETSWRRFQMRYFQPGSTDLGELPDATGNYRGYDVDRW